MTASMYFTHTMSDAMYHAVAKTYSSKIPQNIYFDRCNTVVTADEHLSPLLPQKYFYGGTYMENDRVCLIVYNEILGRWLDAYAEIVY